MSNKLQLSLLCGGQSTEHEISVRSAKNIIAALNQDKYEIAIIYITQEGKWYLLHNTTAFLGTDPKALINSDQADPITVLLGNNQQPWQSLIHLNRRYVAECVFPILHGTLGEDGSPQGLLELLGLPYVGSGPQSSAICMGKDVTKQLLRSAGLPTVDCHMIRLRDSLTGLYQQLSDQFGCQLFVKPANLGSSVGTVPVANEAQFQTAVKNAFRYDERVLVEPRINGREIECAVLGNGNPKASLPGEIILHDEYYSYKAKYIDSKAASAEAPAKLPPEIIKKIQDVAIAAFKALHCAGMARVDFFLVDNQKILINELNTIPGFTNISMYPAMWEASGLPYRDLLDTLIDLAMERHRYQQSLIRIYSP